jgi:hypothetical protein
VKLAKAVVAEKAEKALADLKTLAKQETDVAEPE